MNRQLLNLLIQTALLVNLAACGSQPGPPSTLIPTTGVVTAQAQIPAQTQLVTQASPTVTPAVRQNGSPEPISGSYQFTEGPAVDSSGNVFFSDVNTGKIYQWAPTGTVTVFLSGLNRPNGLAFDPNGLLIACEGGSGRLISIDKQGQVTVLAAEYNGVRFNEPNDLWIDPQGGIYFSDPAYQAGVVQAGEDIYYLNPKRSQILRVIDDLVRPNGLVGTADGKILYVADHGAGKTYAYSIQPDGTLSGKRLFSSSGSDGLELDPSGNLYLTTPNQVLVLDATGKTQFTIPLQENPTNLAFAGPDRRTLFITARTKVYILENFMP